MALFVNLVNFVSMLLTLYMWVVIIAAVITWVNPDPYNPIVRFLRAVTEPAFYWVRRFIPTSVGGFDLAPIVIIIIIIFIQQVVLSSLVSLAI